MVFFPRFLKKKTTLFQFSLFSLPFAFSRPLFSVTPRFNSCTRA